jgi:DNA-binding beta-propeller fold protein YncE
MSVRRIRTLALTLSVPVLLAVAPAAAQAAAPPVRLALTSHITGGFEFTLPAIAVDNDAASPEHGDLYVLDIFKHRVEVLSATGTFVAAFGWEVNATKDSEPAATQAERNLCTVASGDTCQAGVQGPAAGQLFEPVSVAIDPSSGEVYVAEFVSANEELGRRVQAFSAEGRWLFEIGREVNLTRDKEPAASATEKNLCTALEAEKGVQCGAPKPLPEGSSEEAAFNFEEGFDLLAAGGPKHLLYVGDEGRVEEFEAATGKWAGEIPLGSIVFTGKVRALALDQETGKLYLNNSQGINNGEGNLVRKFNSEGGELQGIEVNAPPAFVDAVAVDSSHHLVVLARHGGRPVRPGALLRGRERSARLHAARDRRNARRWLGLPPWPRTGKLRNIRMHA